MHVFRYLIISDVFSRVVCDAKINVLKKRGFLVESMAHRSEDEALTSSLLLLSFDADFKVTKQSNGNTLQVLTYTATG